MGRVGDKPVFIPEGVETNIHKNKIEVKGPRGKLEREYSSFFQIILEDRQLFVKRLKNDEHSKAMQGTLRSLIYNMVEGVTKGFEKYLQIVGLGYSAKLESKNLVLNLGFSHSVKYPLPQEVKIEVINPMNIKVSGCDKQKVGEIAAEIRAFKKPEPYKGKGIRYKGELVKRKAVKRAIGAQGQG